MSAYPAQPVAALRILYVLVYPTRPFAAHWSFWLPHVGANGRESDIGDRIHATGDRLNGFCYEYVRGYDVREDSRHPSRFPVGLVSTEHLAEETRHGDDAAESDGPCNAVDEACREVPAPGPSLNRTTAQGADTNARPVPRKTEVRDCQWWVKHAVLHLAEAGMVRPLDAGSQADTPIGRVERLPRH